MVAQMTWIESSDGMPWDGSRLKERRIAAGFKTQRALAAELNTNKTEREKKISAKSISDYERGVEQPRANELTEIALTVKTSTGYLCRETDVEDPLTESQMKSIVEYSVIKLFRTGRLTIAKLEMAEKFRDLPKSRQNEIVRLLERE